MLELLRKFRTRILLGLLLLGAVLFLSLNLRHLHGTSLFERQTLKLTAPLQEGVALAGSGVGALPAALFPRLRSSSELLAENLRLRAELVRMEEYRLENQRLKRLLDFAEQQQVDGIAARIIGVDGSNWFSTVTIDKGSNHGVIEGMAVVNDQGVVGRIVRCSARSSRVLLITDASSAVASLVERSRTRGVGRGTGAGLTLDYVALPEDVASGDQVVTSGVGGVFPGGLLVGSVTEVVRGGFGMFLTIEVQPAVDFARLEEVLVVREMPPAPPVEGPPAPPAASSVRP